MGRRPSGSHSSSLTGHQFGFERSELFIAQHAGLMQFGQLLELGDFLLHRKGSWSWRGSLGRRLHRLLSSQRLLDSRIDLRLFHSGLLFCSLMLGLADRGGHSRCSASDDGSSRRRTD